MVMVMVMIMVMVMVMVMVVVVTILSGEGEISAQSLWGNKKGSGTTIIIIIVWSDDGWISKNHTNTHPPLDE